MNKLLVLIACLPCILQAQEVSLDIFKPLVGKTWNAEGKWGDGSEFKQEVRLEYDLNRNIVVAKTKGYTNTERTEFGPRNHGIRKVDPLTNTIQFWEFDVFGGLTQGTVTTDGNDIYYQYKYGDMTITDMWEFVDPFIYRYRVGEMEGKKWKQVFLEAQFLTKYK